MNQSSCYMCYENFTAETAVVTSRCGHRVCLQCMRGWAGPYLNRRRDCAYCKQDFFETTLCAKCREPVNEPRCIYLGSFYHLQCIEYVIPPPSPPPLSSPHALLLASIPPPPPDDDSSDLPDFDDLLGFRQQQQPPLPEVFTSPPPDDDSSDLPSLDGPRHQPSPPPPPDDDSSELPSLDGWSLRHQPSLPPPPDDDSFDLPSLDGPRHQPSPPPPDDDTSSLPSLGEWSPRHHQQPSLPALPQPPEEVSCSLSSLSGWGFNTLQPYPPLPPDISLPAPPPPSEEEESWQPSPPPSSPPIFLSEDDSSPSASHPGAPLRWEDLSSTLPAGSYSSSSPIEMDVDSPILLEFNYAGQLKDWISRNLP